MIIKHFFCNKTISMKIILSLILIVIFFVPDLSFSSEHRPLMRFPDIHGNKIVFVYGGDIWSVNADGGIATRLTIHDGAEQFPKFSPDGKMIAFSARYDGNGDVYVMNVNGGNITRVTFHPGYDEVVGWHPVKNKIIFSSGRSSYSRFSKLFLISSDGSGLEELILHEAAAGSFSPDGNKIAFNRVTRENRTWKRYKGGLAQEIYLYDFKSNTEKNLTNFDGTDRIPMWIGDKIYFSSDRDRVLNIYSYDMKTEKIEQITKHKDYDVRRPGKGDNKIVYEIGGSLWVLDVTTNKSKKIPVEIKTDAPERRPYFKKVTGNITGFDCSPAGERALITARGEIFSVPKENGSTVNLTKNCGARDKDGAWSPDGKNIAYLSDKSGEYNIYVIDAKGKNKAKKLTNFKDGYRHTLRWSPDSKKIAFTDHTLRCYYIDITTKKITEVDKAHYENVDVSLDVKPIHDFSWSSDSKYLTYSKMNKELITQVYIYSLEKKKTYCVSNGIFNDFNPIFSKDNKYLFFVSNRRFNPTFCDFEWEMVYKKVAGIYYLALQKDSESLLPYENDEVEIKNNDKETKKEPKSEKTFSIDFDGIAERIEALDLKRGNYRNLAVNKSSLYYQNAEEGDFNRFEFRVPGEMNLYAYSFKKNEKKKIIENINNYKISADGSKIIYKQGRKIAFIDAGKTKGKKLNLTDVKMWLNPVDEWKQIFNEAWRMERDYYYDPNMQGLDWDQMKVKYGKLIPHASCRQDVQFIIGELIGELNTSHTYVYGGDRQRSAKGVSVGMLGVDWKVDKFNKKYQFKKIYRVSDWSRSSTPPLAKTGIKIKENDYLLQVNGIRVTADKNIYSYFQDLARKQVTLLINDKPTEQGAWEVTVKPASREGGIRYQNWIESNRLLVNKKSNGQIGYIHLPDTYTGSAVEFPKYFYSQTRKKGLIIDGRFNGGGLDPSIFLQRLNKRILSYWTRRYSHDQTGPAIATRAHMVCLTNRQAGSGGDELPHEFKQKGMGPVIGTRTWGGLVGVSNFISLIDGGGLTAPDYRIYSPEGKWVVENTGVAPDIEVDLHPEEMSRGYDAQLMKGIEVLMKKIKEEPRTWPKHPAFPVY